MELPDSVEILGLTSAGITMLSSTAPVPFYVPRSTYALMYVSVERFQYMFIVCEHSEAQWFCFSTPSPTLIISQVSFSNSHVHGCEVGAPCAFNFPISLTIPYSAGCLNSESPVPQTGNPQLLLWRNSIRRSTFSYNCQGLREW